jgi:hypothetical protein
VRKSEGRVFFKGVRREEGGKGINKLKDENDTQRTLWIGLGPRHGLAE